MIGINIIVERNGQRKSIESDDELRGLVEFINMYLALASPPEVRVSQPPVSKSESEQLTEMLEIHAKKTAGEFMVRAGEILAPGPFSARHVSDKMLELGYHPNTIKPRNFRNYVWQMMGKNPYFHSQDGSNWYFKRPSNNGTGTARRSSVEEIEAAEQRHLQDILERSASS